MVKNTHMQLYSKKAIKEFSSLLCRYLLLNINETENKIKKKLRVNTPRMVTSIYFRNVILILMSSTLLLYLTLQWIPSNILNILFPTYAIIFTLTTKSVQPNVHFIEAADVMFVHVSLPQCSSSHFLHKNVNPKNVQRKKVYRHQTHI